MKPLARNLLPALLACAFAPRAPALDSTPCPDVRASNVPALVKHEGNYTHCGLGLGIFGVRVSIGGGKCYDIEFVYPAHQECQGAVNVGTACVPAADMPVLLSHCECLTVGVLGTGIAIPKCSCSSVGTAGTIEDAMTVLCHGVP